MNSYQTEATNITGVQLRPGNTAIAHHAVVYLIDAESAHHVDAANGADGQMGYSCFGGASPDGGDSFPTKLVAGWGPGIVATGFPVGTGARVEPGARIVLQMHYSIVAAGPQPDLSSVDFELADSVERNAGYLPWVNLNWPSDPQSMLIPAGDAAVVHEYVADPTRSSLLGEFAPGVDPREGLVIYSVSPHMHKLGTQIAVQLERADGTVEPLVTIARWNFDWQSEFEFEEPVTALPGDQIRLTCTWDNTAANQPVIGGSRRDPGDVTWGEGTFDEMCAASLLVHGVGNGGARCEEVGSTYAESGRFLATFDVDQSARESPMLDGELRGPVYGSIFRDEDVTLLGPADGAEAVARFEIANLDLTGGPSAAMILDAEIPAGAYQILGFMDIDGNADPQNPDPDLNDPVMIPSTPLLMECATQPVTVSFPILLPNL